MTGLRARPLGPALRAGALLAVTALVLGACLGGSGDEPVAGYTPVPDDTLFAQVRDLPHVESAELWGRDADATTGAQYTARLTTDGTVDPYVVIDATAAILRQGYERATLEVWVAKDPASGIPETYRLLDLLDRAAEDPLTDRYGPQPGDGTPPADDPPPPAPGWTAPAG